MSWISKDQAPVGTVIGLILAGITPLDEAFAAVEVPGVVDPAFEVEVVPEVEVEPPVVLTPVTPEGVVVVPVLVAA